MINFWFGDNNFNAVAGENGFCLGRTGFRAAKRDFQSEPIPGRNAPLTVDNGRFETVSGTYQCFIQSGYANKKHDIELWLGKNGGAFQRLEDTEEAQYFRMARFSAPIEEKRVLHNDIARFDVSFELSAERWLKSGENAVSILRNGTIVNPAPFASKPLIVVTGTGAGTLTINGKTINISDIGGSVTMDSETERAYNGSTARDGTISGQYFVLESGNNSVTWAGGVMGVTITPRWWTI